MQHNTVTAQSETFSAVLAHASLHTLGMVYVGIAIAVQCYILLLMFCRCHSDNKQGRVINPTRITILLVAGFLGIIGWALSLSYMVNHWLLIVNTILAVITWGYAAMLKKQLCITPKYFVERGNENE